MKKFVSGMLVSTILFSSALSTNVLAAMDALVEGDNVNIRKEANTTSESLGKAVNGQKLKVYTTDGDFYKVLLENESEFVYISKEFISTAKVYGIVNADNVNIRQNASTDSTVLSKVTENEYIEVVSLEGDWYTVKHDGANAFVHKEFLGGGSLINVKALEIPSEVTTVSASVTWAPQVQYSENEAHALVTADTRLNMRKSPGTDSDIVFSLYPGQALDIFETGGEWARVSINGREGFVNTNFISISNGAKPVYIYDNSSNDERSSEIVTYAHRFIGTPYSYGGTNLTSGVDCSGFVYSVMRDYDIKLGRSSRDMWSDGRFIEKEDLRTGDLVFFAANGQNISHVGIYSGGGKYIHSTDASGRGVMVSDLNSDYSSRTFFGSRRVVD